METRREEILLPTYEQSCGLPRKPLCSDFFNDALKDPILIFITIAVVIGSFCLLSGLFLLCLVSKTMQDDMSESILLIVACVSWKLTTRRQISHFIEAIKEETG
ncbi:hypothetical protein DOY81_010352 [Sarcophaga bullata]|nr:hypothetical protein DOY81_010352 [Sarcophaga bullata]